MSYMKEYMLDQVYKLGEKAGLTPNEAEDIYLNICDGDFEAYYNCADDIYQAQSLLDNRISRRACGVHGGGRMMKEMVYGGVREQEVIYSGEYKGFDIAIVNLISHPCAYIRMPDDMMEKLKACHPDTYDDYDSYDGSVHGGYTYCSYGNLGFEELKTGLWLGWDYAHLGDYYWTSGGPLDSIDANGKKWTVGEILANAFEAVDTLEFDDGFSRTKYEDRDHEDRDHEPEPIRINLNEPIKVKLTDWGKEIYYHQYDKTKQIAGREICKPKFPKEDENGYTEFQLWRFIELYGMHMGMPLRNVIEPLEIVYERKNR